MQDARDTDIPRTIRHLDSDQQWAERDIASKAYVTASEAAHRLRGLAGVLYGIGIGTPHRGPEMAFLGATAADIALALERVNKAMWAAWEARDVKLAMPAKSGKKSRRGRRASA